MAKISSLHATAIAALHISIEREKDGTYTYVSTANPLTDSKSAGLMEHYSKGGPVRSLQAVLAEILTQLNSS